MKVELFTLKSDNFECIIEGIKTVKGVPLDDQYRNTSLWALDMLTALMGNMDPEKRKEFLNLSTTERLEILAQWVKHG